MNIFSQIIITSKSNRDTIATKNLADLVTKITLLNRAKETKNIQKVIDKLQKESRDIMEQAIARAMGASVIKTRGRTGLIPDFITEDGLAEAKSVTVETDDEGNVLKARGIDLGTISLVANQEKTLITGRANIQPIVGRDFTAEEATTTESTVVRASFVKYLIDNAGDQKKIKKALNGRSKIAKLLRKNIELKSANIRILYNSQGKTVISGVGWTWKDIFKNKKASIKIIPGEDNKSVKLNVTFTEKLLRDAINTANKSLEPKRVLVSEEISKSISRTFSYLSAEVTNELNRVISKITTTVPKGSVLLYTGTVQGRVNTKKSSQQFISGVQWTALTQKRLGETMERLGPPNAPYLKERSGRFRGSVQVSPDYRRNTLRYMYMPLYSSLTAYGYDPDRQVTTAIREVAQSLYTRKFNITRM